MIFSILVLGSPVSGQSSKTALRFTQAALASGHQVFRVFFLDEGVVVANSLVTMPQDECHCGEQWRQLALKHQLDMVVCVSSALKRGVLDQTEATRFDKPCANLASDFTISGLGQLVDATAHSDRVITFGA